MDSVGYESYCQPDSLFYESPARRPAPDPPFADVPGGMPADWTRETTGVWTHCRPPAAELPAQGWKVHVSACRDNAGKVLSAVWEHCVGAGHAFKFLANAAALDALNGKYAPRGSAGKFITVYPGDAGGCARTVRELGERLRGQPGPDIPGDLRCGDAPVFVRFGGFRPRYCWHRGRRVRAIEAPDGTLVPDEAGPRFRPPPWVQPPGFLAPFLAARDREERVDLPYTWERALHLSNGAGVFLAREPGSGRPVVIKEARAFAGLDAGGNDALARLRREWDLLTACRGLPAVPAAHRFLDQERRGFLVQEFLAGVPLDRAVAARHPLATRDASGADRDRYADWARRMCEQAEAAVACLHDRGIVFGDLHPGNLIAGPDDRVRLVDFEAAFRLGEPWQPALGHPGFAAPPGVSGADVDRYALAALRLSLFLPLTGLVPFAPSKPAELARAATELFRLPAGYLAEAAETLIAAHPGPAGRTPRPAGPGSAFTDPTPHPAGPGSASADSTPRRAGPGSAPADRPPAGDVASMARAILAGATPEREDRLFPGDIAQFHPGGAGLAYGAAGVLYALWAAGVPPHSDHVAWLAGAARRRRDARPGLYDGRHGVAYTLACLGLPDEARTVAAELSREGLRRLDVDLFGGLAGIGLARLGLAEMTGDTAYLADAAEIAAAMTDRPEPDRAGLMRGASGPALFLVRLFEATGDAGYLDRAARALRRDLAGCVTDPDGRRYVRRGASRLSHLAAGAAGVVCVLDAYLAQRDDEELHTAAEQLARATDAPLYVQSGLFNGRAGALLCRAGRSRGSPAVPHDRVAADHLRRLSWHALSYRGEVAYPGDRLLRLSMDLATGTAGVLLAVAAATSGDAVHLPFLAVDRGK
ncbi:class III lanthionine synthetase LanKC [Jidongwangia harbinensis]|uniref:class III lanthionine synthetase LanKC n=1 Tax=Jidongwangia harbinensis TaxID=2878561 RepID=UPI001CD9B22F|nr:class III lanthionine synthetase LanKC [Jidongwangia harbinensis]MCA2211688.1 class III lanthionine synthetase LanKC [Jidongwangia harbinensis]